MSSNPSQGNPFNDQPTIQLLADTGEFHRFVSQREASRLLRTGQANLLLCVPPAVQLLGSDSEVPFADSPQPDNPADQASFLHARRSRLYGNIHFQSPTGEVMFHGDNEKGLWYLNRGLVEVVSQDPPVLRFLFPPGGRGHAGDLYYLSSKQNCCVVCGATNDLNRHHVVPSVYRRHLPAEVKDHSHHDVVLLCLNCHELYERAADDLKAKLGEEFGIPLHGVRLHSNVVQQRAHRMATALRRHGDQIPPNRQEEMMEVISQWLGHRPTPDEVTALAAESGGAGETRLEHGLHVVSQTGDVQIFVQRWREHFLHTMQPRYMPDHWDVNRPASRNSVDGDWANAELLSTITPGSFLSSGSHSEVAVQTQFLNPTELCPTFGWTHVVTATGGKTVHISGQVSVNERGEVVGKGDLQAQVIQTFENIHTALKAVGATFGDVVKMNLYVVGLKPEHVPIIREVRGRYVSAGHPPASTLVGVSALVGADWLIEIEAMAVIAE